MPRPKRFTDNMERFCIEYLESGNATQAYLKAYETDNKAVARQQGYELLKRDDVREYLENHTRPTVNLIVSERERKRQMIWKAIERCEAKEDEAGMARWMDILNKMDAEYININRNINDTAEQLSELSTEQLQQLIGEPTTTGGDTTEE